MSRIEQSKNRDIKRNFPNEKKKKRPGKAEREAMKRPQVETSSSVHTVQGGSPGMVQHKQKGAR